MSEETKNLNDEVLDTTTVVEADVNIDELFGSPGADNIMLPSDGESNDKPKSLFSKENVDTSFLEITASTAEQKQRLQKRKQKLKKLLQN